MPTSANSSGPFLETSRRVLRTQRFGIRMEESYLHAIRDRVCFRGDRNPEHLGCLSHLAAERSVTACTQSVARCALLFLCLKNPGSTAKMPGAPGGSGKSS